MLTWEEIVQDYIARYSNSIQSVSEPLKHHFGIEYFTYHRIDSQGKYTVLVDRPDWAEYYVSEKFFLTDPFLRHPDLYKSGMALIETCGSLEHKEKISKAKNDLSLDLAVVVIEKHADSVEFFGFSANQATSSLAQICLNHSFLLKAFAAHFKREMHPILAKMDEAAPSLLQLKGSDFYTHEPLDLKLKTYSHHSYLKEIGMAFEVEQAKKLSRRERECLELLLAGESAKGSAQHLNLSPRTIESYLENIRAKLGCVNKEALLSFAKKLKALDLF